MSLSRLNHWLKEHKWLQILGSGLMLASLLFWFPLRRLLDGFRQLDLRVMAAAVPLFLVVHLLGALKWRLLLKRSGAPLDLKQTIQCYFFGLFGNLFLPSVVGGDALMVALAVRKSDKRAGILMASFLNRALDLLALLLVSGAALALIPSTRSAVLHLVLRPTMVMGAGAVVLCAAVAVSLRPARVGGGLRTFLDKHPDAFEQLRHPFQNAKPLAFSILIQAALIAINAWVAAAGGLHLPWTVWLLCWPLAKLTSMVPVAIGGIGTRELALVALMTPFGAPAELVATTGMAWEVVGAWGSLAGGAIWKAIAWSERQPGAEA